MKSVVETGVSRRCGNATETRANFLSHLVAGAATVHSAV